MLTVIVPIVIINVAFPLAYNAESAVAADTAHLADATSASCFLLKLLDELGHQTVTLFAGVCGAELIEVVRPLRHKVSPYVPDLSLYPPPLIDNVYNSRLMLFNLVLLLVDTALPLFQVHLYHTLPLVSFLVPLLQVLTLVHFQFLKVLSEFSLFVLLSLF